MWKLWLFKQSSIIASGYFTLLEKTVADVIKRKIYRYLENTRFISRVEHDISHDIIINTRNKSDISTHPRIILYLFFISGE